MPPFQKPTEVQAPHHKIFNQSLTIIGDGTDKKKRIQKLNFSKIKVSWIETANSFVYSPYIDHIHSALFHSFFSPLVFRTPLAVALRPPRGARPPVWEPL